MIFLIFICVFLTSCSTFYKECTKETFGQYRCNGDMVEMCTGTQWSPRTPCDKLTVDGVLTPERCVADGDGSADCEAE
jgi:hypothetical protein